VSYLTLAFLFLDQNLVPDDAGLLDAIWNSASVVLNLRRYLQELQLGCSITETKYVDIP
jgi:hypothetical protein